MRLRRCLLSALPLAIASAILGCSGDEAVGPSTGLLEITTVTSGVDPDPDGYTVQLDAKPLAIGVSATLQQPGVLPGSHTVSLTNVASNCTVSGEASRTVTVVRGDTSRLAFAVECAATPHATASGHIVFRLVSDSAENIYIMDADGGHVRAITADSDLFNVYPRLSPDGSQVAFQSSNGLVIRDTTGSNERRIPIEFFFGPVSWSPDGAKLAVSAGAGGLSAIEIWVLNIDGTGLSQVTTLGGFNMNAVWSPDGTQLALAHAGLVGDVFDVWQLYLVNVDGSNPRKITELRFGIDPRPAWSPDGSSLAFSSFIPDSGLNGGQGEIFVMPPVSGAIAKRVTFDPAADENPVWSPDRQQLAFARYRDGQFDIYTMAATGGPSTRLTHAIGFAAVDPDWGP